MSPKSSGVVMNHDNAAGLFRTAKQLIHPGIFARAFQFLYSERKLVVTVMIHLASTLIIWGHFALIKFTEQKNKVPDGAPNYWWKVIAPTLEFGAMHAILFQMALIPLTMSRFSIAGLTETVVDRFVPLNRALRIHIHLGYTMISIVFLATVFFFIFFGKLCADGEQDFCDKFTTEIICTGYGILAMLLIIGGTSYFRYKIPYEVFYVIHHLVFAMYLLTIIHTFDHVQRNGERDRSQTFKWFSASLLFYVCDRAAMHLNHKYHTPVVSSSKVTTSNGTKMIILKVRRPPLFRFKPGQYAFLRQGKVDVHWHPFSIASCPSSPYLEFYIEVFSGNTWTEKVWDILQDTGEADSNDHYGDFSNRVVFEVMGPYGTSLLKTNDFSHAIAVGAGTGIVPILGMMRDHIRLLHRLSPVKHFENLKEHEGALVSAKNACEARKGSVAQQLLQCFKPSKHDTSYEDLGGTQKMHRRHSETLRSSIYQSMNRHSTEDLSLKEYHKNRKEMKRAAFRATREFYGIVLLVPLTVLGVVAIGLTISWNTLDMTTSAMTSVLQFLIVCFQLMFAITAIFVWEGHEFFAYLDLAMSIVTPFMDWYFFRKYNADGILSPGDITMVCLLVGYMTGRVWNGAVRPIAQSWACCTGDDGVCFLERLEVVWVTRSADLVSKIAPDIIEAWDALVKAWGRESAFEVCRISIYITDKDKAAQELLREELADTDLYRSGRIMFSRPDFGKIIQDHTIDLICTKNFSSTCLAFCGSPHLSSHLSSLKFWNDMVTAITGYKKHQMEFVSESYGGIKSSKARGSDKMDISLNDTDSEKSEGDSLPRPALESLSSTRSTDVHMWGDLDFEEGFKDEASKGQNGLLFPATIFSLPRTH